MRAGSLDYARVESGRSSGDEEIWGFTDHFQQFWNSCGRKRVIINNINNPLTTIGSYTTHENSPGNSPDFVTPASRFGWPARSRHAVACMHRFSHILRASCVPAVWIMPEWRAVDRAETRKYEDLPIISSSSEIAAVVRGLMWTEKNARSNSGNWFRCLMTCSVFKISLTIYLTQQLPSIWHRFNSFCSETGYCQMISDVKTSKFWPTKVIGFCQGC